MMLLWGAALVIIALAAVLAWAAYRYGHDAGQLGERAVWLEREWRRQEALRRADRLPPVEWLLGPPPDLDTRELRAISTE